MTRTAVWRSGHSERRMGEMDQRGGMEKAQRQGSSAFRFLMSSSHLTTPSKLLEDVLYHMVEHMRKYAGNPNNILVGSANHITHIHDETS